MVFDDEGSYSIGVVMLEPGNPLTLWVGTGENNSQRSVGYGDGVYKSMDGGKTWKNMGLKDSGHISMIRIHPADSKTVWVAAQGPLWNSGGDRGLYKTTDGGKTWRKIEGGLPSGDLGRIGLAAAPSAPNIIYAIVEANDKDKGVYRSTDFGESWDKRSDHMTQSPQYYNELYVDPNNPERVYSVDTFTHVSEDGGASWNRISFKNRHVDDHALASLDHLDRLVGRDRVSTRVTGCLASITGSDSEDGDERQQEQDLADFHAHVKEQQSSR